MTSAEDIDQLIAGLGDWRGRTLAEVRRIIRSADPAIVEEVKWMGSPTWSLDGLIAVGDAHKAKVKLTFARGAALPDPDGLFNGDDKGQTRRSIDLREGARIDETALQDLVRAAIQHNRSTLTKNKAP